MPLRKRPPPPGFLPAFLLVAGMFAVKAGVILVVGLIVAVAGTLAWLATRGAVDRIGALLAANMALWVVSGLVTGGVSLGDLVTPGYYQEEGRIFLYYVPLAYFSVAVARREALGAFTAGAQMLGYVSGVLLLAWIVFSPGFLSRGTAQVFVGLMTSHTAAGTVFGALAVFLMLTGLSSGRRRLLAAGGLAGTALFGTASRQGIVALIAVLAWYVVVHGRARANSRLVLAGAVLGALLVTVTPDSYQRLVRVLRPDAVVTIVETLQTAEWEPGALREIESDEDANVLVRMLYWGHAYRLFARSPILGVGFGRYNDEGVELERIAPGLAFGLRGTKRTELASAHNSYLHVAAEVGIVGLGLLLLLWVRIFRRLGRAATFFAEEPSLAAYYVAAQGLVLFTLAGALFGHALAAPAIGVTVLSVVGLGLAVHRSERSAQANAEVVPTSQGDSRIPA